MKVLDEHFESARRHFGVALIDLHYAAADLARSTRGKEMRDGASAAELLHREIERLTEISAFIDRVAELAPDAKGAAALQRWWPDFVRPQAEKAVGD